MMNVSILEGHARNVRGFIGIDIGPHDEHRSRSSADVNAAELLPHGAGNNPRVAVDRRRQRSLSTSAMKGTSSAATKIVSHANASPPKVVVTFSGTDPKSIRNWIDDLEAVPVSHPYNTASGECEKCWVHRGFLAAYNVVKDQVRVLLYCTVRGVSVKHVG